MARLNPLLPLFGLGVLGLAGLATRTEELDYTPSIDDYTPYEPEPDEPGPDPGIAEPPPGQLEVVDGRTGADVTKRWENRSFTPVGVTLHQMGLSRSSASGSHPEKLLKTAAHFVVMRDGRVLWLHPLDKRVKNSGYKDAIQVEVEGNFQSTRGKWWVGSSGTLPKHTLNPAQAVALPRLLAMLEPWLTPNEYGLFELSGHRMAASKSRRGNDPGPEVWTASAPWALNRNWQLGPVLGEGTDIPSDWYNYVAEPA